MDGDAEIRLARKGWEVWTAERRLSPIPNYEAGR